MFLYTYYIHIYISYIWFYVYMIKVAVGKRCYRTMSVNKNNVLTF